MEQSVYKTIYNAIEGESLPEGFELPEENPSGNIRWAPGAMDGVYAYTSGPCYETPAEIQAYKAQGADVVGMSTVPEAVFAKACGMKVAGVSLVSNLAAGISRRALNHEEVMAAGEAAKPHMAALIDEFIVQS